MKNFIKEEHNKFLKLSILFLLLLKTNYGISNDPESKIDIEILKSGTFFVGANYWASHAGTAMWSDWRPDVVEKDFQSLLDSEESLTS